MVTAPASASAQLYNPKTSVGYNLGKVTVWPPTQPNEYLQMYSLCQVQVNLAIPAGEYNVRPPPPAWPCVNPKTLKSCTAYARCRSTWPSWPASTMCAPHTRLCPSDTYAVAIRACAV